MPNFSRTFVAVCIAVLACCISVLLYARVGVSLTEALVIGLVLFTCCLLVQEAQAQRDVVQRLIARVDQAHDNFPLIADHMARLDRQLAGGGPSRPDKADQSAEDVAMLGAMVKDLADTVAALESRLAQPGPAPQPRTPHQPTRPMSYPPLPAETPAPRQAEPPAPRPERTERMPEPAPVTPAIGPRTEQPRAATPSSAGSAGREIMEAVSADRIETFLQPIVTLPQRKVKSYEVLARLRMPDGALLMAEDFLPAAEALGLAPVVDIRQFLRASQIVRRLSSRSRDIQVMLTISPRSLVSPSFMAAATRAAEESPAIAAQILFQFDQAAMRTMSGEELAPLKQLFDAGYRFVMDQVADLRVDGRILAERGFRLVKAAASLLVDPMAQSGVEIHAADLAGLLRRNGIELVADGIESESAVVDLLDYDVGLAQGDLFSPPRPVRADVISEEPAAAPAPVVRPLPQRLTPPARAPEETTLQDALAGIVDDAASSPEPPAFPRQRTAWRTLARRVSRSEI